MANPAIIEKYGPYHESAIFRQLPQREAIGKAPITPSELAGATYGELSAKYEEQRRRQIGAQAAMEARESRRMAEKGMKGQQTTQAISGVGSLLGGAALAKKALFPTKVGTKAIFPMNEGMSELSKGTGFMSGMASEAAEAATPAITGLAPELAGMSTTAEGLMGAGGLVPALAEGSLATGGATAAGTAALAGETAATGAATAGAAAGPLAGIGSVLWPLGLIGGLGFGLYSLFGGGKKK